MSDHQPVVILGTYGHVKGLESETGADVWETSLPATGYELVSVARSGSWFFAGSKRQVFGLESSSGAIVWNTGVEDPRSGPISLSTGARCVFVGAGGFVRALERETGEEVWATSLFSDSWSESTTVVPNATMNSGVVEVLASSSLVLAGSDGHAFGLDPDTGEVLWWSALEGTGHTTLADDARLAFVGADGHVIALDKRTGERVWQTGFGVANAIVSVTASEGGVYAGCAGQAYGLDPERGQILWKNSLEGMKYKSMILASDDRSVFVGTHGHALALDKRTGETSWATSLPESGYDIVSVLSLGGVLVAGSDGLCFGLDPADGRVVWDNGLSGLGQLSMTFAHGAHAVSIVPLWVQREADKKPKGASPVGAIVAAVIGAAGAIINDESGDSEEEAGSAAKSIAEAAAGVEE